MSNNFWANATFLPGAIGTNQQIALKPAQIVVILLVCVIISILIVLLMREICKLKRFCSSTLNICRCCSSPINTGNLVETCNCCQSASIDSCLDSCCPTRSTIDLTDLLTCGVCCPANGI